jgi:hypothetical protein
MIDKLLIAVTFHYNPSRLIYLERIAKWFSSLAKEVQVVVVTNAESMPLYESIQNIFKVNIKIVTPKYLGHPYLLTWSHLDVFREMYKIDDNISHFMYLEDDIEIKLNNIEYWLRVREDLRYSGFIPSFMRYEIPDFQSIKKSTDVTKQVNFADIPKLIKNEGKYCYVNIPQCYQGMYLLDRELAHEHFFGESSSPDFGVWGIREKAAQGLTFAKVKPGFFSRNLLGFNTFEKVVDEDALIHHTPNNYANDPGSIFGKLSVDQLIV